MGFNPTSDIHGVTDQGEFQFLFIANVSIDDFAVMDTDGNTERLVSCLNASVPRIDGFDELDRTLRSVGGVAQAGQRQAEKGHQPITQELVDRTLMGEHHVTEHTQVVSQRLDDYIRRPVG